MENVQPYQVLIPFGIAAVIALLLLVFGDRPELAARIRGRIAGRAARDLSRSAGEDRAREAVVGPVATTTTTAGQRIAMRNNAGNDELPGNVLPEEAREVVRFHAKVEAVVAIVTSGKIGQTEAIERIFNCTRSSKPDSVYARARAAVVARQQPAGTQFPPLTPEQQRVREWVEAPPS